NDIMVNIKAADNFVGESLIHVKQPGVSFQGISFQGDNNGELTTSTLVGLLYDFNQPDLDSYIKRCNIQRFKIGILSKGRNLRVLESLFSGNNTCLEINKFESYTQPHMEDIRGIQIKDNLFHSNGGAGIVETTILNIKEETTNQKIYFH